MVFFLFLLSLYSQVKGDITMNNEVIARIDISTSTGRKIVRELEKRRVVKMEYPIPESVEGKTYTHQEIWETVENKLNDHHGTTYKLK